MAVANKIIITRFSAMGDVAMVASVLREFAQQFPEVHLIMVTRGLFEAFFKDIPNLQFHPFEPKKKHKGIKGLIKLKQELTLLNADAIVDLHYNLRSRILTALCTFSGLKLKHVDKARKEKKALTRKNNKVLKPLRPMVERYADVFRALGFTFELKNQLQKNVLPLPNLAKALFADDERTKIGIAAFAQHPYKVFPKEKMEEVLAALALKPVTIYIFGGGKAEQDIAEIWQSLYGNVHNTIGRFTLEEELSIISNLDLMLSMDSSGMHMASLMGIRCLSIWGATHPYAGFLGYGQQLDDAIQVDHPNRPNSIYGNIPCDCDGIEAIDLVSPDMVTDRITTILKNQP